MPGPENAKDVLSVIGVNRDQGCDDALIDVASGLALSTVDEIVEFPWRTDQFEGIMTLGGRNLLPRRHQEGTAGPGSTLG